MDNTYLVSSGTADSGELVVNDENIPVVVLTLGMVGGTDKVQLVFEAAGVAELFERAIELAAAE